MLLQTKIDFDVSLTGERLKEIGMEMATDSANAQVNDWSIRCYELLKRFIKIKSSFTCEDFRSWIGTELEQVKDNRAFGGTFNKAAKDGLIRAGGFSEAKNARAHKCPKRVWIVNK